MKTKQLDVATEVFDFVNTCSDEELEELHHTIQLMIQHRDESERQRRWKEELMKEGLQ